MTNRHGFVRTAAVACASAVVWTGLASAVGCAGGAGGAADREGDAASASAAPIASDSATLIVHGMSCPKCANNIDLQVREVRGVSDVEIDMRSGRVRVAFLPGLHPSERALASAIERTGFTLVEIRTP